MRQPDRCTRNLGARVHEIRTRHVMRDEERSIGGTLRRLAEQTDADFTVAVVDNASTDGTVAVVRESAARHPKLDVRLRGLARRGPIVRVPGVGVVVNDAVLARGGLILRPHAVYGPGDTTLLPRVLSAVRGPFLTAAGTGRERVSLTSIGNLVQACLLAARGPVGSGVFNIADAVPVTLDDAFRKILRLAAERTLDITAARTELGYDPRETTFAGAAAW